MLNCQLKLNIMVTVKKLICNVNRVVIITCNYIPSSYLQNVLVLVEIILCNTTIRKCRIQQATFLTSSAFAFRRFDPPTQHYSSRNLRVSSRRTESHVKKLNSDMSEVTWNLVVSKKGRMLLPHRLQQINSQNRKQTNQPPFVFARK